MEITLELDVPEALLEAIDHDMAMLQRLIRMAINDIAEAEEGIGIR